MIVKSYAICPVSDKKVSELAARINAVFTVLLLVLFGFTQNIFPVIFLTADFFLRASQYSRYSLIGLSSRSIVNYFSWNKNLINAGPKIFAARIGFVISSIIILSSALDFYVTTLVFAGILGLFSFLEAAFGLCVACEIYPFVHRLLYREKNG